MYRPPAADVVFVELPGMIAAVVVGTATRDVLVDERTAEEDLSVDGEANWMAVLVLGFPGDAPPRAGETDVGDELDPGTTVAVTVLAPVPGAGIAVPVGPVSVTVYTTVPVTTVSVEV